jgi:hypothetical protein
MTACRAGAGISEIPAVQHDVRTVLGEIACYRFKCGQAAGNVRDHCDARAQELPASDFVDCDRPDCQRNK